MVLLYQDVVSALDKALEIAVLRQLGEVETTMLILKTRMDCREKLYEIDNLINDLKMDISLLAAGSDKIH